LVSKSLKEYADLLHPNGFVRTHQSHLVNPKYVKSWLKEDGGILLLMSGEKIPISRPNRNMVKLALQQL
jgi:two-component system LytT family response regulator